MNNILSALSFYVKNSGWHTFAKDSSTKKAIKSLEKRGFLEINSFNQARYTGKIWN